MNRASMIRSTYHICISMICVAAVAFVFTLDQSFAASSIRKVKVTEVKAKVVADKTVRVSWKKRSGVKGYTVYVSAKKWGRYKAKATVKSKSNYADVKKLKVGETYYFKVRPYTVSKGKKKYGRDSKRIKCTVVPVPHGISAVAVEPTTGQIRVSFGKSAGASGYELYRATSKGGSYTKIKALGSSANTFVDKGLTANKNYYYKIRPFVKDKKNKTFYGAYSGVAFDKTGGNSKQFDLAAVKATSSPLRGKKILFLGSSITYGSATGGVSFVEYLARKDGVIAEKNAVSGTTISTITSNSYVDRLRKVGYSAGRNMVVCQLSTNDPGKDGFTLKRIQTLTPLIEDGSELSHPDQVALEGKGQLNIKSQGPCKEDLDDAEGRTKTIRGAIDYITVYSNYTLKCPVVFYVPPEYNNMGAFKDMRDVLHEAQQHWTGKGYGMYIIDLWDTGRYPLFSEIKYYGSNRPFYMADDVHPTKAGYYRKFLPAFEKRLGEVLN